MTTNGTQKLLQIASFLLCVILAWKSQIAVEGTEFSGGWLTGSILSLSGLGSLLCLAAILLTFRTPRTGAVTGLIASILCLPLHLYFVAPGPYRWIFRGEYSVPLQANFAYDQWAILGILSILVAVFACVRGLQEGTSTATYNEKTADVQ